MGVVVWAQAEVRGDASGHHILFVTGVVEYTPWWGLGRSRGPVGLGEPHPREHSHEARVPYRRGGCVCVRRRVYFASSRECHIERTLYPCMYHIYSVHTYLLLCYLATLLKSLCLELPIHQYTCTMSKYLQSALRPWL